MPGSTQTVSCARHPPAYAHGIEPCPESPPGANASARRSIMHPGVFGWWSARRRAACGAGACAGVGSDGGGPWGWSAAGHGGRPGDDAGGGGGFGVRRPLRFLAYKLDLDEAQTTELAAILSDLKTERAPASADH